MNDELIFRQASSCEVDPIMRIIRQAQARMRAAGSLQWQDGYPAPGHISTDISRGRGYVICRPDRVGSPTIIAYGAVIFDGEPAYEAIDGEWLTDEPYVVVHRMAVAENEQGRGVATALLHQTQILAQKRGVSSFRIDTNHDNHTMLRLLEREGFAYCGKIVYTSGQRLAYEKQI